MDKKELGKTTTGIEASVEALLCYLVGFITGIVFLVIEKENKYVRFHAMQSIIAFGFLFILSYVIAFMPFLVMLTPIVSIVTIILWIIMMIKAYQGEKFKLPIAGDIAEKNI